jgi:hypothetical protein
LQAIEEGKDPLGVVRDPAMQNIDFPQRSTMMEQTRGDMDYRTGFTKEAATLLEEA